MAKPYENLPTVNKTIHSTRNILPFVDEHNLDALINIQKHMKTEKSLIKGRSRRQVNPRVSESDVLSCGASNCSRFVCLIENLEAGQHVVLRVQARLWVDTIQEVT